MDVGGDQEASASNNLFLDKRRATSSQLADINISPLGQLRSSYASIELPTAQADAKLRFPVDDLIEPVNSCELHINILEGTGTKKVAVGVVNAIDRMRTPRIHGQLVPEGYARVSVDRVERGCASVPLKIEGGDGEKTLGEVGKTFICWRKRFIIIPRVSPPPPRLTDDQDPQHRCVDSKTIYSLTSYSKTIYSLTIYSLTTLVVFLVGTSVQVFIPQRIILMWVVKMQPHILHDGLQCRHGPHPPRHRLHHHLEHGLQCCHGPHHPRHRRRLKPVRRGPP